MKAPRNLISMRRGMQGMTLIDLLVGIGIALLGTMIMLDSLVTTQRQARVLAGTTDAQNAGWQGLYTLERDVRAAGYGMNLSTSLGCNVRATTLGFTDFTLAPIVITPGPTPQDPVTLTVSSGSTATSFGFTRVLANANATAFTVANRFGVQQNDFMVLAEPGRACTLALVTQVPVAIPGAVVASADAVTLYTPSANAMNLGDAPVNNIYTVQGGRLMLRNNLTTVPAMAIASNVVGLGAQYGKDDGSGGGTAGDGIVDVYNTVAPVTAQDWARVKAVRIGMLVRSPEMDKPDSLGNCTTTTTLPGWQGGTFSNANIPSWTCYRYRVFETTAPVRNMIWSL